MMKIDFEKLHSDPSLTHLNLMCQEDREWLKKVTPEQKYPCGYCSNKLSVRLMEHGFDEPSDMYVTDANASTLTFVRDGEVTNNDVISGMIAVCPILGDAIRWLRRTYGYDPRFWNKSDGSVQWTIGYFFSSEKFSTLNRAAEDAINWALDRIDHNADPETVAVADPGQSEQSPARNTVTAEEVADNMKDVIVRTLIDFGKPTTHVTVRMKNGFVLRESTTCVDPVNYNEEIGKEICLKKIEDKVWFLLGYALQEKLYQNGQ